MIDDQELLDALDELDKFVIAEGKMRKAVLKEPRRTSAVNEARRAYFRLTQIRECFGVERVPAPAQGNLLEETQNAE